MKKRTLSTLLMLSLIMQGYLLHAQTDNNFSFVFLTDIHVQPERQATEGLLKAIAKVNQLNPDFVITGGDLIMDALDQSQGKADSLYQLYIKTALNFNMPVYNTPGNHEHFGIYKKDVINRDHPDYSDGMYKRYLGRTHYSFNHKGWHFIVLNSVMETEDRRYRGGVSSDQLVWLENDLSAIPNDMPVVVSVHIPLVTAQTMLEDGALAASNEGSVINNNLEVLNLFKGKNLKLVLQGHLHLLEDLNIGNKVHFITGGAVSANWWRGPRNEMEEGFLKINVKGDAFDWEYVDFGWEAEKN